MPDKKRLIELQRKLIAVLRDYVPILASHADVIKAFANELEKELETYEAEKTHTNSQ